MTKYVVFLRGVNVGGRIVKMSDLKICLEATGLKNVKTLLQSGSVVFGSDNKDTSKLKSQIEKSVTKYFRYPAKVQVVSIGDLQKIIDSYPFAADGTRQHDYVIFMENGLEIDIVKEEYSLAKGERVQAGAGVVYWRVDKGSTLKSKFSKLLSKPKYKDFNTNRNLNTLRKITAV